MSKHPLNLQPIREIGPYELPTEEYRFMMDIRRRFGIMAQSVVQGALCKKTYVIYKEHLPTGFADAIKSIAHEQNIELTVL